MATASPATRAGTLIGDFMARLVARVAHDRRIMPAGRDFRLRPIPWRSRSRGAAVLGLNRHSPRLDANARGRAAGSGRALNGVSRCQNAEMKYRIIAAVFALAFIAGLTADARAPQHRATTLPPGNIEHGRYLAEHVAMCIECHSRRDASGNILPSDVFEGGPIPFAPPWPNDWANRAPRNKGLPGYSDE